ncbi:MAG TPA: hypothetical protein VMM82_08195 [Spirochaetia bacterium]|nr:hypothetical protein [Spirochaetia bacterium]
MSPLESVSALRIDNPRLLERAAAGRPSAPPQAQSADRQPPVAPPSSSTVLTSLSSQATLRQAQMLLLFASNVGASPVATPALRQIAAAAYQMEIDARREIARVRAEGMSAGRQWFA